MESWAGPGNEARVPESLKIVRMGEGDSMVPTFSVCVAYCAIDTLISEH